MTEEQRVRTYYVAVAVGIVGVGIWATISGLGVWPFTLVALPAVAGWWWATDTRPSWGWLDDASWWARLLFAVPVGLAIAIFLIAPLGEQHMVVAALLVAEIVALLGMAAWTAPDRRSWFPGCAGIVLILGVALYVGWSNGNMVDRYCRYGAVSQAQYQGCLDHVDADIVRRRDSPAARYAKGE